MATDTITSTQTWTSPAGVTNLTLVQIWGPGGNGYVDGGGGGGGAYTSVANYTVTPSTGYTATVPSGGSGANSWFNTSTSIMAVCGADGDGADGGMGGDASSGLPVSGSTRYSGGNGGSIGVTGGGGGGSSAGTAANGANGADGIAGTGGAGGTAPSGGGNGGAGGNNGLNGVAGSTPGGGGGGAGAGALGGAGARAEIKLTYTTTASAGDDQAIEADQICLLAGSAVNYTSVAWTTAGDGTFTNPTSLTGTYTPGEGDRSNGSVVLTLTASRSGESDAVDTMTLTINDDTGLSLPTSGYSVFKWSQELAAEGDNNQDTFLSLSQPTTVKGAIDSLTVGFSTGQDSNILLRKDLTGTPDGGAAIPAGATITSATLSLYVESMTYEESPGYTGPLPSITIKLVDNTSGVTWKKAEATWNIRRTGTSWGTTGGDFLSTPTVSATIPTDVGEFSFTGLADFIQYVMDHSSGILDMGILTTGAVIGDQTLTITCPSMNDTALVDPAIYPTLIVYWESGEPATNAAVGPININASSTNYLDQLAPTTNRSASSTLKLGAVANGQAMRPILVFDVSSIPATAIINSASLVIYTSNIDSTTGVMTIEMTAIRRTDYSASQSTWNIYKTGSNWAAAGAANTVSDIYNVTTTITVTPVIGSRSIAISQIFTNSFTSNGQTSLFIVRLRMTGDQGASPNNQCLIDGLAGGTPPYIAVTYTPASATTTITQRIGESKMKPRTRIIYP